MTKHLAILITVLLASFLLWYVAKPWISDPTWSTVDYSTWLIPLVMLMFTGAVVATALILLSPHAWRFGTSAIVGVTFLLVFGITKLNLLALVILFLFHFWAMKSMSNAVRNHLKIDFRAAVGSGIRKVIMPLLIMLSFVYFANPDVQASARQNQLPLSITKAVEGASRLIAKSELNQLPVRQREQAEDQIAKETIELLNRSAEPYRQYFPPLLAFGLFLVLQGLGFIFIPVAGYIAGGLFEISKITGFVTIIEKDVKAEELVL